MYYSILRKVIKNYYPPIQARGPSPNGKYTCLLLKSKISGLNLLGWNSAGFSKYFGSLCMACTGMIIRTPTSIVKFRSLKVYLRVHSLIKNPIGGKILIPSLSVHCKYTSILQVLSCIITKFVVIFV